MSFPNHVRGLARQELGREWGIRSAAVWTPQEPDYETLRRRALHDLRGTVLRHGVTYHGDGRQTQWCLRRAVSGRTDQFELVANGRVFVRGGKRRLPREFKPN